MLTLLRLLWVAAGVPASIGGGAGDWTTSEGAGLMPSLEGAPDGAALPAADAEASRRLQVPLVLLLVIVSRRRLIAVTS